MGPEIIPRTIRRCTTRSWTGTGGDLVVPLTIMLVLRGMGNPAAIVTEELAAGPEFMRPALALTGNGHRDGCACSNGVVERLDDRERAQVVRAAGAWGGVVRGCAHDRGHGSEKGIRNPMVVVVVGLYRATAPER